MNKIELLGRICRDIEIRYTTNNEPVAKFTIAVDRRTKEQITDFFDLTAFGKTAELINQYFKKGQKIAIVGRLQNNNYEDKEGKKHFRNAIVVEEFYFCNSKSKNIK